MAHEPWTSVRTIVGIIIAVIGAVSTGMIELTLQNGCGAVMLGYGFDLMLNKFPEDNQ